MCYTVYIETYTVYADANQQLNIIKDHGYENNYKKQN